MGGALTVQAAQAVASGTPAGEAATGTPGDVVIIPVDQSKQAEKAFEWYANHVHRPGNVVRIIHCQETPVYPMPTVPRKELAIVDPDPSAYISGTLAEPWDITLQRLQEESSLILKYYDKKLKDKKMEGATYVDVGKTPGEIIVNHAKHNGADMIIMGSRGFGVVRRTILGSVSDYVLHHSNCPVTIVPPKEDQHIIF